MSSPTGGARKMTLSEPLSQLAIEIGTSRIKLGKFAAGACPSGNPAGGLPIAPPALPEPADAITLVHNRDLSGPKKTELSRWFREAFPTAPLCCFASVQPAVSAQLLGLVDQHGWPEPRQITWRDIPLEICVDEVARVGIDRLLDAVAANTLRDSGRPAIVVDLGTAGTVNLIDANGAFQGGAILPGMVLAAQALHAGTSSLPPIDAAKLTGRVDAVGRNTCAAISAGIFWGLIGAVNELVAQVARQCTQEPQLFVTGGAAPQVAEHLHLNGKPARHVPHMVLSAIRLVAEKLR